MLLRIQYAVGNILPPQHSTNNFRRFNRSRSDQHRLTRCISLFDLLNQSIQLLATSFKDQIVRILSDTVPIRRNYHHAQPINILKLIRFRLRRPRHSGQLLVQTKIVLNRNRRQCLRLPINLHPFLCFHRLMQSIAPPSPGHESPRVLVHDDHLVLLNHIVHILLKDTVRTQKLTNVVNPLTRLLVFGLGPRLRLQLLLRRKPCVRINIVIGRDQIRHREKVWIVGVEKRSPHLR